MFKVILLAVALGFTSNCYSQRFIDKTQAKSLKILKEFYKDEALSTTTQQTDTTLVFLLRDIKTQNLDIKLHFDSQGKCDQELYVLSCDSCYHKFIKGVLENKRYNWTKVDEKTYMTQLPHKIILSTEASQPHSYVLQRSSFGRNEYRQALKMLKASE